MCAPTHRLWNPQDIGRVSSQHHAHSAHRVYIAFASQNSQASEQCFITSLVAPGRWVCRACKSQVPVQAICWTTWAIIGLLLTLGLLVFNAFPDYDSQHSWYCIPSTPPDKRVTCDNAPCSSLARVQSMR